MHFARSVSHLDFEWSMSLLKHLGLSHSDPPPRNRLVAAIRERLEHLEPRRAEFVAAFAGLLARVARADEEISDVERAALRAQIAQNTSLSRDESEAVADIVVHQAETLAGIDYASLTRTFNEIGGDEEKVKLIDCLYRIATADSSVSLVEDEAIRAVSNALLLPHSQFIEVRSRYKEQLEVLRELRRARGIAEDRSGPK